MFGLPIPMFA